MYLYYIYGNIYTKINLLNITCLSMFTITTGGGGSIQGGFILGGKCPGGNDRGELPGGKCPGGNSLIPCGEPPGV